MSSNNCIANLLKFICLLQENSTSTSRLENGCAKPYLGLDENSNCYNTRVIQLYKRNGKRFSTSFTGKNKIQSSNSYRVVSVNDNCCTLLILNYTRNTYNSTHQYITVDLKCIGAIRCIRDVTVNNL